MARQLTLFMESMLEHAANMVKRFYERYSPDRFYVFFSAGKDSAAVLAAVAYAGDSIARHAVVVYNELAGNTHPLNVEQAYRVLERLGWSDVVRVESPPYHNIKLAVVRGARAVHIHAMSRYREDFWRSVERWGIPVMLKNGMRWCLGEFKAKHWYHLPQLGTVRYSLVGVKVADSGHRRRIWSGARDAVKVVDIRAHRVREVQHSPILYMTDDMVWQLLREAGIDRDLRSYEMCGDSVNCVFCPFRRRDKQLRVARCTAETAPWILERARRALETSRSRGDSLTARKAQEWLEIIRLATSGQ